MRQEIAPDRYGASEWDLEHTSRCFVHLCDAMLWHAITGSAAPPTPCTADEYTRRGLPWFNYDIDGPALDAAKKLQQLRSVLELANQKGDVPFADNSAPEPDTVIDLSRANRDLVREGEF